MNRAEQNEMQVVTKWAKIGGVILVALILAIMSFTIVNSGEVGVKVRMGKVLDISCPEGINLKIPFVDRIVKMDTKVKKISGKVEAATKDLQAIQTEIAVNYHLKADKAAYVYKTIGKSYEETVIHPAIYEAIKTSIVKYDAEEIHMSRSMVSISINETLQSKMEKYGIIIDDVNLTNFTLSEEYMQAVEDKQITVQAVEKAKNELEKAKIDAETKKVQAEAEAEANKALEKSLTDAIIKEEFLKKWDGKLPLVSSDSGTMINIDSLMK